MHFILHISHAVVCLNHVGGCGVHCADVNVYVHKCNNYPMSWKLQVHPSTDIIM